MKLILFALTAFASLQAQDNPFHIHREAAISSASGTPWSSARHVELVEKAAATSDLIDPSQRTGYPISEETLQKIYGNRKTVPFFAYSSMIDKNAGAVQAISPEGADTQEAAIAFGIQRTFNRRMAPETVEKGWGPLKRPNDLAILNVFEKEDAVLNGVLFQLPIEDLLILTKREVGYSLMPVLAMKWENAFSDEPELFVAYTFLAPEITIDMSAYTSFHINPIPGYFTYLQKGLDAQGEAFKAMWWATTFLADQKTPVSLLPYQNVDMK